MRKTYSGFISALDQNSVFVFGSNTQGRHGAGAALVAVENFGAIYGQSVGWQGQSYAICTKDLTSVIQPSVQPDYIVFQIEILYWYALANPSKDFYIIYSGTGTNLNGYTNEYMAEMFADAGERTNGIPPNIVFEQEFLKLVEDGQR